MLFGPGLYTIQDSLEAEPNKIGDHQVSMPQVLLSAYSDGEKPTGQSGVDPGFGIFKNEAFAGV